MLNGLTAAPEFRFIREMHYRDEFTSVDHLQQTANRYYIDQRSRNASGPVVSGRGAAMAVASSTDQCHQCKEYGHFKRDCPQQVQKSRPKRGKKGKGKQGGGGNYQPKWCSKHNTSKHSDAECNKQKEFRDKKQELQRLAANLALLQQAGQANFLNIGSAHPAQSSPAQPSQPEPTTFGFSFSTLGASLAEVASSSAAAGTPPAASDAKPVTPTYASSETPTQDHRLPHGVFWCVHGDSRRPVACGLPLRRIIHLETATAQR